MDAVRQSNSYDGLRSFLDACEQAGEVQLIEGADWNVELGTLTEAVSEKIAEPPALLFDNIKDYGPGYRVLSLMMGSTRRCALALGMSPDVSPSEFVRTAARKIREAKPVEPIEVATGPVMENVITGADVDIFKFPAPKCHDSDGGRYVGTGDTVIMRDPVSGYINMGTYRIQAHEKDLLGLWISPGKQGRLIAQSYWDKGQSCPVAVTFGGDPLVFMLSSTRSPWGVSELARVGGLRGAPLAVIKGPITGLPIPAHCEVAIEGEVPPPSEQSHEEGPFGEWPGYYSGGTLGTGDNQPVIRIKAIYHRNNPILVNMGPQWPGAPLMPVRFSSGLLWDQLEAAGVPDIQGVHVYNQFLFCVSIKQRYAGHARQTGMAALGCAANAYLGRYVVIVDEDIDPSNIQEVLWAMETRVDPASDIQIVDNMWAGPLDPRMPPEKKKNKEFTNSRAVFYAVRPFAWKDKFPMVNRASRDALRDVMEKYKDLFPFAKV